MLTFIMVFKIFKEDYFTNISNFTQLPLRLQVDSWISDSVWNWVQQLRWCKPSIINNHKGSRSPDCYYTSTLMIMYTYQKILQKDRKNDHLNNCNNYYYRLFNCLDFFAASYRIGSNKLNTNIRSVQS